MQRVSRLKLLEDTRANDKLAPLVVENQTKLAKLRSMAPSLAHILQEVRREVGLRNEAKSDSALNPTELHDLINTVAERLGFTLANFERDEILAHLENDSNEFGLLQELVDDPSISDVIATDYSSISIQQGRRNLKTDLSFPNQESYEAFVERLLQRAGTTYSTKKPIADGMIGSYVRVHAVHRSLCETGPYLTLRINRFSSVTTNDLLKFELAPLEIFQYLQGLVHIGRTVLVVGEVGSGKTTLVRALAASMPEHESILVIEDTPEIVLEHPHARYVRTREANVDGEGRVAPSQCIRAGMRMAMNRIIFGEMRDAEAAESFIDVCASGHPGLSTIHARSATEAIARLELFLGRAQKGVSRHVLSEQIATAVQAIVFVDICKETRKRRIMEVKEIGPVADGMIRQRDMFKYYLQEGRPTWRVANKVSAHREKLESSAHAVHLNRFPNTLELNSAAT